MQLYNSQFLQLFYYIASWSMLNKICVPFNFNGLHKGCDAFFMNLHWCREWGWEGECRLPLSLWWLQGQFTVQVASGLTGLTLPQCEQEYQSDCIWQPSCPWLQLQNKLPTSKSLELEGEAECWAGFGQPERVIWFTMSVGKVLRELNKFPGNETACSL